MDPKGLPGATRGCKGIKGLQGLLRDARGHRTVFPSESATLNQTEKRKLRMRLRQRLPGGSSRGSPRRVRHLHRAHHLRVAKNPTPGAPHPKPARRPKLGPIQLSGTSAAPGAGGTAPGAASAGRPPRAGASPFPKAAAPAGCAASWVKGGIW